MQASIIIPSYNRQASLEHCLKSLYEQSTKPHEIIVRGEEGPLAAIRNKGAREATGDIVIFIDDDVVCNPDWLRSIIQVFERDPFIAGVSGPSVITEEFRRKRDLFRYHTFKRLYDLIFCPGWSYLPGHITKAGAWTTGACNETCTYEGPVMFLEACNMAFKRSWFEAVGGFDEEYRGIGDWSEPDLAFRIRERGGLLWFTPKARLYHEPSQSGAFHKRKADASKRMENYLRFSRRWVTPCWRHNLYKLFMRTYYALEAVR